MARDAIKAKQHDPERDTKSDTTLLNSDTIGDIYIPLKGLKERPLSPTFERVRSADLKVDGPLTPLMAEELPPWKQKKVSFKEALHELISDPPSSVRKSEDLSSDEIDRFVTETIKPIAEQADRRVEQEQLQDTGAMMRVKVPVMDFTLPTAPWEFSTDAAKSKSKEEELARFLQNIKLEHMEGSSWPLSRKVERELRWTPFTKDLAKVAIEENLGGDEAFADFVAQPECPDYNTLIWKRDGLRVLDESESDYEEIEEAQFSNTGDFRLLMRKRKLDLIESKDELEETPPKESGEAEARESDASMRTQAGDLLGGTFSAFGSIENFMDIKTGEGKRPKLETSSYFRGKKAELPKQVAASPESAVPPEETSDRGPPRPILLPEVIVPNTPRSFIISSTLLVNRSLTRKLRTLYPYADFIERDFSLHNVTPMPRSSFPVNALLHTPQPSRLHSDLANEADLLLSPSTALINTTLQRTKQLPLPGAHPPLSALQSRILATAPRYEHLILLISQGTPSTHLVPLSARDTQALTSLDGFCTSLTHISTIETIFVPGNEDELAAWIVSLMVRYSGWEDGREITLLQEETLWEVWLRRAGMNAFAAQAVLGMLKALDGVTGGGGDVEMLDSDGRRGEWGLSKFVSMGIEERCERFAGVLGGERLLRRISDVVDAQW